MPPVSTLNHPDSSSGKIASLNQDLAYILIKYLKGLDVINFMEAVNGSKQFQTVEISEEYVFYKIFTKMVKEKKVTLNVPYLDFYLETCSVDAEGYVRPNQYQYGNAPILRLFIHPSFTVKAFDKLCCAYKTPSFQCYGRLLPFNTHSYVGDLTVVDYFNYRCSIGSPRELNWHEQRLFKGLISKLIKREGNYCVARQTSDRNQVILCEDDDTTIRSNDCLIRKREGKSKRKGRKIALSVLMLTYAR
jgi:hypothetical protein